MLTRMCLKKRKRNTNTPLKIFYENAYCLTNKTSVTTKKLADKLIFQRHGTGYDLSMMRISYKLTKRPTKTEKFEKSLKKYNIIKTICYKLTASGTSIIQSSITSWVDRSAFYGYIKKKNRQKQQNQKIFIEKSVEVNKKWTVQYNFSIFS